MAGFRSASYSTTLTSSVTVACPAGVQAGDVLLAVANSANVESGNLLTASGWVRLKGSGSPLSQAYVRTAGGSEPASYTFSVPEDLPVILQVVILAYSGVQAVADGVVKAQESSGTRCGTSSMSPTNPADMFVAVYTEVYQDSGGGASFTVPSGLTQRYSNVSGDYQAMVAADRMLSSTHSVPSYVGTWSIDSDYLTALSVLLKAGSPPAAATLVSPASGSALDCSTGVTFSAVYNSTDGSGQSAYAFRIKPSAGSYQYWNADTGALQGSIVWNPVDTPPGGSFPVTLPAGILTNGNTYNWSVASQNSIANQQGPFATDFTVTTQVGPTVVVTGPSGTVVTPNPTIFFTTTPAAGLARTGYRVVVYSAAQYSVGGFAPGVSAGSWDSGFVAGTGQQQLTGGLANSTSYRAYVQATETGGVASTWEYGAFDVQFDTPAAPTLTATPGTQGSPGGVVPYPGGAGFFPVGLTPYPVVSLTVSGHDNLLPEDDASFETTIGTWAGITNATVAQSSDWSVDGTESVAMTATAAGTMQGGPAGVPVTAGSVYTGLATMRAAATARSVTLALSWRNSSGTQISSSTATATDSTTVDTALSVTATAPAGAVTVRVILTVTSAAASEVHYVDQVGVFPGTVTGWTRGGLAGAALAVISYLDAYGNPAFVRGTAPGMPLPAPDQTVTVVDAEVIPGTPRTYTAWVEAFV